MAAGFATAMMVVAELTLLPASIHDAQANPCSENVVRVQRFRGRYRLRIPRPCRNL